MRFSLRLVLSGCLTLTLLTIGASSVRGQEKAAEDLKADQNVETASLPDIRLSGDKVTEEAINQLAGRDWGTIALSEVRLNGTIIEGLRRAKSIRALHLSGTHLSGQLPRLETIKGLVDLEIASSLQRRDLEAIGRLTNLERLNLPSGLSRQETINVIGARELAKLVNLKSLRLYGVNVDDAAFVELRTLTQLEELDVTHTSITDEGLAILSNMPKLRKLELYRHPQGFIKQQLTDACIASITKLPDLERLSLSGKITDAGLKQIAGMPKLKALSILGTEVSGDGLAALENSMVENLSLSPSVVDSGLESLKKCRNLKNVWVHGQPTGNEDRWMRTVPTIGWGFNS